jgi:hypothetical protein
LRILTDPTFDEPGDYKAGELTFTKTSGPAIIPAEAVGRIDLVLFSHDQNTDNLDHAGRALLLKAGRGLTTLAGARRRRDRLCAIGHGLNRLPTFQVTPCMKAPRRLLGK